MHNINEIHPALLASTTAPAASRSVLIPFLALASLPGDPTADPASVMVIFLLGVLSAALVIWLSRRRPDSGGGRASVRSADAGRAPREEDLPYRTLFRANPHPMAVYDLDSLAFLDVNDATVATYGYSRDELLAMTLADIRPPEDIPLLLRDARPKPGSMNLNEAGAWRHRRKDGSIFYVEIARQFLTYRGRQAALAMAIDITDRRRAEAALRESEDRNRDLIESNQDMICTHDLSGKLLSVNEAACRLTGYSREQLLQMNMADLIPAEARAGFGRYLETIKAEGRASGLLQVRIASGEIRFWEYDNSLRTEDVSEPVVRGWARDVTERKRAEDALRESEARLANAQRIAGIGSWERDFSSNRLMWSEETFRIFGLPPDRREMTFEEFLSFIHPDDKNRYFEERAAALKGEKVFSLGHRIVRPDGEVRYVHELAELVTTDDGRPLKLTGTVQDVTERRAAEENLRRSETMLHIAGRMIRMGGWTVELPSGRNVWSDEVLAIHDLPPGSRLRIDEGISFYAPEWKAPVLAALAACVRDGTPFDLEAELITAKQRRIWVRTIGEAERDAEGRIVRVQGAIQDITGRKRAEEELRETTSRLRGILHYSPFLISEFDLEGRYLLVNSAIANLFHKPAGELVGRTFAELLPPEAVAVFAERIERIKQTGEHELVEDRLVFDGVERFFSTIVFPLFDAQGWMTSMGAIGQDVTERKRAEEALRETSSRLVSIMDNSPLLIVEVDLEGRYLVVNRAVGELFGAEPSQLVGMNFDEVVPSPLAGVFEGRFDRLRESLVPIEAEDVWDINGQKFVLDTVLFPLFDADRKITSIGAIAQNITGRKLTEEALRENEALMRIAGRIARLGGWRVDLPSRELTLSDELCALLEISPESVKSVEDILPYYAPGSREQFVEAFSATLRDGSAFDQEFQMVTATGKAIWVHTIGQAIRDESGAIVRLQGATQDISELKKQERERDKLEGQLRQAQKMEAVGRLAGGVAHDFNNMLTVILGHGDLALLELEESNPVRRDIGEIIEAARRSAELTRQLLAFARQQTIAPQVLDLNQTISSMLKMLGRLIGEDVELVWNPGKDLWKVKMDPAQIDQILANLAVNSRDAIEGIGRITIESENVELDEAFVETHPGALTGKYAMLVFSDTGCGMVPQVLAQIFEPFFTTKPVGKGTGLGLATVYGILKQNNGYIAAYSEPGKGTSFRIYLPRHETDETLIASRTSPEAIPTGTETILLVEDEAALLRLTRRLLEELGYTVIAADRPTEAIRLASEYDGDIQLLLTDVVMPKMSGRELLEGIAPVRPGLKSLFMSGYTADVIANHGILHEGLHFLQKPFTKRTLAAKVREALQEE